MKRSFLHGLLFSALMLLFTPAYATDMSDQIKLLQQQIKKLSEDMQQKQLQIDTMQKALEQVTRQQLQKEPEKEASQPVVATDDAEVLFSNEEVFASSEKSEHWPGWLNTFNINGNTALRYEARSNNQLNRVFTDTFRLTDFNLDFSFEPTSKLDVNLGLTLQEVMVAYPVRDGLQLDDIKKIRHQFLIKYASADYTFDEALRLRFGAFLTPFGVYNESLHSDYDSRLVERPFMSEEIIPAPWTQLGVQLHGDFDVTPGWQLHYALYSGNGLEAETDRQGVVQSDRISDMTHQLVSRFNSKRSVGGRFGVAGNNEHHQFELGFSGYHGAWDPMATLNLNLAGADLWYHYDGLDLRAEWALARQNIQLGRQYDYGWYTQLAYRWKTFEPVVRYDRLKSNFTDQNGFFLDHRHRYTVGMNLYLGKFFVLKAGYSGISYSTLGQRDRAFTTTLTAGF